MIFFLRDSLNPAGKKALHVRPGRITRAVTGLWFRHRTDRRSPLSSSPAIRFPCGKGMSTIKDNTPTYWRHTRTWRSGVLPPFQTRASPAPVPSVYRNSRSFVIIPCDATELVSVVVGRKIWSSNGESGGDKGPDWGCTFLKRSKEKCLRRLQSNLRGLAVVHTGAAIFVENSGFTEGFLS